MCGIVGICGTHQVTDRLLNGLQKLEYRGYDSAGIAVFQDTTISRRRASGKLENLRALVASDPAEGKTGIAHTRWATHGAPSEANAHPHQAGLAMVVHNGIIENHADIRAKLAVNTLGELEFESQTDTEVIAHLFDHFLKKENDPKLAFRKTLDLLEGAYAILAMNSNEPDKLYCARLGSPLVIGHGEDENYVGSDSLALTGLTQELTYLEEGDWAVITPDLVEIYDQTGNKVERPRSQSHLDDQIIGKSGHDHFMFKEIMEQPSALIESLSPYIDFESRKFVQKDAITNLFAESDRGVAVACGSAYLVCKTSQYWFESYAKFHLTTEIASEFRYRNPVWPKTGPALFVSQSGETADTLRAVKFAAENKTETLAIVNVPESSIARAASHVSPTQAGPEIGVASTKAFTAQLLVMLVTAFQAAKARGHLSPEAESQAFEALTALPDQIRQVLLLTYTAKTIARELAKHDAAIFIGRGQFAPIAEEGALKLKEIAYIYASAYPAGELKHGPIALLEQDFPVIAIAPMDDVFHKTLSNLEEVKARGAQIILITDAAGHKQAKEVADHVMIMPTTSQITTAIMSTIPLQLLAYYTAIERGTNVDMPRNLAKSVTVE